MNEDDIGCFYTKTDEDGIVDCYCTNGGDFKRMGKCSVWQLVAYTDQPTATLMNILTEEKIGGVVGSLNLKGFVRLVPEQEGL